MDADIIERLDDRLISGIAAAIYSKLVGADFDVIDHDLRLRLALEQRLTGSHSVPFGLDRLSTTDAAAYLGLQAETLRATAKRKALDLPTPYTYGKKLYWRRSELDAWVEQQRRDARVAACWATGGSATATDRSKSDRV
jgi:predicted DNA-binding transcriptional regulator AlpA